MIMPDRLSVTDYYLLTSQTVRRDLLSLVLPISECGISDPMIMYTPDHQGLYAEQKRYILYI